MKALSRPARLRRVAVAAALALALTACGSEDGDTAADPSEGTSESSGAEAPEQTEEEPLAAEELFPAMQAAQQEAGSMAFEVTTEATGVSETFTGEGTVDPQASRMTGTGGKEVVVVDEVFYIKDPALEPSGKFIKIDLNDPANASVAGLVGNVNQSPTKMIEAMGTPKSVEVAGTEDVAGVSTTHYVATIDAHRFYKNLGGMLAQMADQMPPELVIDLWVDGDDLVRKMVQEIDTKILGRQVQSRTQMVVSEYGQDVEITAPPAGQVSDKTLEQLISGAVGG